MRKLKIILAAFFLISPFAANADLIEYNLAWTGSDNGYSGTGAFSFDDASAGDNLITASELISFVFTIFDPLSAPIHTYLLANADSLFSFNFETDTEVIRTGAPGGFPSETAFLFLDSVANAPYFAGYSFCGDFVVLSLDDGFPCNNNYADTNGELMATRVSVPEPGTLALLGIGLFGMGLARRNKKA